MTIQSSTQQPSLNGRTFEVTGNCTITDGVGLQVNGVGAASGSARPDSISLIAEKPAGDGTVDKILVTVIADGKEAASFGLIGTLSDTSFAITQDDGTPALDLTFSEPCATS